MRYTNPHLLYFTLLEVILSKFNTDVIILMLLTILILQFLLMFLLFQVSHCLLHFCIFWYAAQSVNKVPV